MKFLLEFVVCCGFASLQSTPPAPDDTRSLVLLPSPSQKPTRPQSRRHRSRKRGRSTAREWRPSLSAIYEDNAVPEREQRMLKKKAAFATAARVEVGNYNNDIGRSGFPIITAFSPSPCLF